jgi:eukaryotic-like serine/threonine-protein kinase
MDLKPGTRFGPYEILSRLGAGGMGVVYRARDTRLGRDVAIKVLLAQYANDADRLRRFEQEARATSTLNHPNILQVFDVGTWEGSPYIVSELLEGATLRERLRSGPFSGRSAVDFAMQVARGLGAAHQKGIVHRDLKPENIFVMKDGRAKILDFGLAKLSEPATPDSGGEERSDTKTGRVLGTAGYMSPEQVRGQRADERSDIFSLGAIFYEMLSGERAFHGPSEVETMNAILTTDPSELAPPGSSSGLATIITHCLAKDPADRFQTAQDLAFNLESIRDSPIALGARPQKTRAQTRRKLLIGAGVAAMLIVVIAAIVTARNIGRRTAPHPPPPTYTRLTFRQGNLADARFAPDGQTVVYGAAWDGKPMQIFTTRIDGPESRPLNLPAGSVYSISRRGMLAVSEGCELNWGKCRGTLAQVSLTGGSPRKIAEDVDSADWSPIGTDLAIVRPVGGRYRLESPIGRVLFETTGYISSPRFSPDGRFIAFCNLIDLNSVRGSVAIVDLAGNKTTLSDGWLVVHGLAWRNNDEIWFNGSRTSRNYQTIAVKLDKTEHVVLTTAGELEIIDISRQDGALFFRTSIRGHMFGSGGSKERELSWFDWSTAADISADGKTVLFYEWGDGARGTPEVYVRTTDGADATRLGAGKALALSPDGRWALAVVATPKQHLVLLPTGAGDKRVLKAEDLVDFYSATFFPDGHRILIAGEAADHVPRSYIQDIDTGALHSIGAKGMIAEVVSPDGKRIAVYGLDKRLYVLTANGEDPVIVEQSKLGDSLLQWSDDGRALYVRAAGDESADIDRIDLISGQRAAWKHLSPSDRIGLIGVDVQGVCISRDGKSYAYTYWKALQDLYFVAGVE